MTILSIGYGFYPSISYYKTSSSGLCAWWPDNSDSKNIWGDYKKRGGDSNEKGSDRRKGYYGGEQVNDQRTIYRNDKQQQQNKTKKETQNYVSTEEEEERKWEEEQRSYQEYQENHHLSKHLSETQDEVDKLRKSMEKRDKKIASLKDRFDDMFEGTDIIIEKLYKENVELRAAIGSLRNYDEMAVTWEIPSFQSRLTDSTVDFRSQAFPIGGYNLNLELNVRSLRESSGGKADRSVSFFFTHFDGSSLMPIQMEGSTVTIIGVDGAPNLKQVAKGEDFQIKAENCGFGWTRITTLGKLCARHLHDNGSVRFEARARIPKSRCC